MINDINENSILVIPNNIKNNVLKELNKSISNIKIMSLEELIKKLTFDYNEETIYRLMKYKNINYDIAKNYIKNIYYVENKDYNNEKLNELVKIKEYLIQENLLICDYLFEYYIKDKNIIIYGYDYLTKLERSILEPLNYKIINIKYNEYTPLVYEAKTLTEEVEFTASKICELINDGIDINQIKLVNVSKDYYNEINKIFSYFNIPININKKNIYGTQIVRDFINNYSANIENTLSLISEKYNLNNPTNKKIYNKLISICNEYIWCDSYLDVLELITNKLKSTSICQNKTNAVEITTLDNINHEYVFLMNANQLELPKIHKDEDYLDDYTKEMINIETSIELNKLEKEYTVKKIKNIKNIIITYKLKTPFSTFYKSSIIEELTSEINDITLNPEISYSAIYDKIKLTNKIDNLIKFNSIDSELDVLYSNYKIDYNSYNNNYTKIDSDKLIKYLDNKLLLSYSSMDTYYHCGFRYYLNNILKLNPYEETFYTKVGSLFHYVLEKTLKNNDDYKKYYEEYKSNLELTPKEGFLLGNLEEDLKFTIDTIKKQMMCSSIKDAKYEEKIYVSLSGRVKVTFMGVIDKMLIKETNGETLIALIDYKTGSTNINLNNTYYGLSMQLPIYLYLASNTGLKNIKFIGFYLQHIINNETVGSDDLQKEKEEVLKLNGYSIKNKEIISYLDDSYEASSVIKGMRTKSDGEFYSYTKVLTEEQISNLIKLVNDKIEEAKNNILSSNFDINPKQIGYTPEPIGCDYCTFKDICFKREENIVKLKEKNYQEFLGGEENVIMD